ncbi:hypothetical protein QN277_002357 [Acacia crassicarpa]|uniref:Myb/SANT-like domain-containing protein n=1 Tax=Acacia crassicarpa TaxID=499986 RepID=A0AAE1TJG8_9FABA|nr:hypothetical protein QN277_002357 [Acacia crassicarpa]
MTQKTKEPINLRWTPEMDESFIEALLEEMMNGNRPDGTFSTFAYGNMVQTLNNRFGSHITKQHLKNRKKTLSQRFAELYDLFNGLSGFSWSPLTKLFEADNQVWDDLIKRKPNARKWKNTPVLHYDKLYELFSADKVSVGTTSVREQKRKASTIENESNQDRFEKMTAGIKELVDVIRDGNVVAEKQVQVAEKQAQIAEKQAQIAEKGLSLLENSRPRHYSEGEVWTAIEKFEIPEEKKLKYYFFLCNEERHKLIFFGVSPHMRLQTLLKLMTDARAQ